MLLDNFREVIRKKQHSMMLTQKYEPETQTVKVTPEKENKVGLRKLSI